MLIETGIAIGGTGLAIIALAAAIISSSGQSSFLYANARLVARTPYIIEKKKLTQLLESRNLPDMINQLKDTEYYHHLETISKDNITEFNMALEQGLIESIKDIKKISPKKFHKVFEIYSKLYESKIIKTFFRSRFSMIKIERKLIEPIGAINPILLKHLHDTKTIADMKLVLRDTEYNGLFEKEHKTIEEFDFALEKMIMEDIDRIIKELRVHDRKILIEVFREKREIKNILTLLKFRIRSIDRKIQENLMIKISGLDMKKAISSPDIKSFVECFSSTGYEKPLKNALKEFEKDDNYHSFEKELLNYYNEFVRGNDLMHSIGPYPIISYITKKEIEQKNLLIIAKGIVSGMKKEDIERMTIQ